LAGQVARALRMLDGLQAEGEAPVLVHWTLAEDIRALKRVRDAIGTGKPLPMALREARVCDGLVKGLKHPDWPLDPWEGLKRLVLMTLQCTAVAPGSARGHVVAPR